MTNNSQGIQPAIRITTNLIGVPALEVPVDEDIDIMVSKSGGQMTLPCLLIQILREIRRLEEKIGPDGNK